MANSSSAECNVGVALKSLEDIQDTVDPRLSADHVKRCERQCHKTELSPTGTLVENIYVDFKKGDSRDPRQFSNARKWYITMVGSSFTALVSATTSTYTLGFPSMMRELNATPFEASVGISVYALGFGIVPLVTTSFSEEFGRRPLYLVFMACLLLTYIGTALSQSISTVVGLRFLAGAFACTGATLVGGTVADLFDSNDRGLPMSLYALTAIGAVGIAPAAAGYIEQNPHLQWRWIQWFQAIVCGVILILSVFVLTETRSTIILEKIAKQQRKETGDERIRARSEVEKQSLSTMIYVSCTRPLYLLCTEPIVASISVWLGFAWGVFYALIDSVGTTFRDLHHFTDGEIGLVFLCIFVGAMVGWAGHYFFFENLYHRHFAQRGPESRLYGAAVSAIFLPIGMFIYAWTSFEHVHWIAPCFGIVIFIASTFNIYLTAFTYLADCYGPFASSGMAGQSLFRNLMGTAFPLFTGRMFAALTVNWALTLFGGVAVLLAPVPFVLFVWGPKIRQRSKFSVAVMEMEAKAAAPKDGDV